MPAPEADQLPAIGRFLCREIGRIWGLGMLDAMSNAGRTVEPEPRGTTNGSVNVGGRRTFGDACLAGEQARAAPPHFLSPGPDGIVRCQILLLPGFELNEWSALTEVERCLIGLMVAQRSGSAYWLSVQSRQAEKAGLTKDQISGAREGCGDSDRRTALLFLAGRLVINRGELAVADLAAVRQAGLSDAEITEVILHVGLNLTAAAIGHASALELDFPPAPPLPAF